MVKVAEKRICLDNKSLWLLNTQEVIRLCLVLIDGA